MTDQLYMISPAVSPKTTHPSKPGLAIPKANQPGPCNPTPLYMGTELCSTCNMQHVQRVQCK